MGTNGQLALITNNLLLKSCITDITELYNTVTDKDCSIIFTRRLLLNPIGNSILGVRM